MFEDGVYVSYFSDDEDKKSAPKSVVIIENGKIQILVNPATPDEAAKFLTSLAKAFAEAVSEDEKDFAVARLGKYWEWNGYTPNPSDFFELDSDGARRFIELSRNWASKQDNEIENENNLHDESTLGMWRGTGLYYNNLEVRYLFARSEYLVTASFTPAQERWHINTIITANSLEEAIDYIQNRDYSMYDEATLDGSGCEGG